MRKYNFILSFFIIIVFLLVGKVALASDSTLYIPLIGLTSVPEPLVLPQKGGNITYNYAVKNFLREVALTEVQVTDDKCDAVTFVEGDDNGDAKLDYSETWRYSCTTKIFTTTQSIATATGVANNLKATHKAYTTVVVGSTNPPPLVSIINVTKVAYPLSLPAEGGKITFTYKVNNPGIVPLSNVTVSDDKCSAMSNKLGDTNGNNLLDINEVWIYNCVMNLRQTTVNTVTAKAFANGLEAVSHATITVKVETPSLPSAGDVSDLPSQPITSLPAVGSDSSIKIIIWSTLSGILVGLIISLIFKNSKQ